jgi:L-ascorbate metabolism protein UlaG (beta-lactamase superfamily)
MLISYHGHSEFLVEMADGRRVLFDPFPAGMGYPVHRVRADVVAISHQHFDHNYVEKVDGNPVVVDSEGRHTPLNGITLTGTPAWHDKEGGKKRGQVLCFTLEAEGLKVLHLGDLGEVPNEELKNRLFMPDILFIPVGGFYTIDAGQAAETVSLLQPRIVIPMHYRARKGGNEQIAEAGPFLDAMKPEQVSLQPLLRVTREDLSQQPRLVQLSVR